MLPEQVWDEAGPARCQPAAGQPAGSAVPLVWAHAEYLKLLRSALDGKVFDRIDPVYERYCEPEGRQGMRSNLEIYSLRRPIQKIAAGNTLRILDENRFEVVWIADGWRTTAHHGKPEPGQRGLQRGFVFIFCFVMCNLLTRRSCFSTSTGPCSNRETRRLKNSSPPAPEPRFY